MTDFLQDVLAAKLILVQSDMELEKLEAAVDSVSKLLSSRPTEFSKMLLLAPGLPSVHGDAFLDDVLTLTSKEWRTIATKYPGKPTEFLKSVLWCALVKLANDETAYGRALGVTLPVIGRNLDAASEVVALWQKCVDQFQTSYEQWAEDSWSVPSAVSIPGIKLPDEATKPISASRGSVSAEQLSKFLQPAFSAQTADQSENLDNGNPHGMNVPYQWGAHAATTISKVLAGGFADALAVKIDGPDLDKLSAGIERYVEGASQRIVSAVSGQDLRTRLLWWKESEYSPSARKPWSELSDAELVIHSAIDLAKWLPDGTPPSAFHFICSALPFEISEEIDLAGWVNAAKDVSLDEIYDAPSDQWSGRYTIEILDAKAAATTTGHPFSGEHSVSPRDMLDTLLREILAIRILSQIKATRKPRV